MFIVYTEAIAMLTLYCTSYSVRIITQYIRIRTLVPNTYSVRRTPPLFIE